MRYSDSQGFGVPYPWACTCAGNCLQPTLCPVRIVWGTEDRVLPWPSAAERYRTELAHADWVVLDGVGHCPQLDVPLETAELILGFTSR